MLRQGFQDYELVLVDDASTDGSADVIREYSDRATVVLREQNGGEMAARNSAMEAARGEYVCFLDSDDLWFPWTLQTFAEAIKRHNRPTVISGNVLDFHDQSQVDVVQNEPYSDSVTSCYFTGDRCTAAMCAAISRAAIEEVGRFLELRKNGLDSELMFRIGDRPGLVQIESPVTIAYRQHGGNIMGNTPLSYLGAKQWIDSEFEGKYPGGAALRETACVTSRCALRAFSVQCISDGYYREAIDLYRGTFNWNLELRRWVYLITFPLMIICPPLLILRRSLFRWRKRSFGNSIAASSHT